MITSRITKFNIWETSDSELIGITVRFGGGKSQTSTSQVSIPPEILAQYENVNSIANQVAQTPFTQYSTDPNAFVAPLTPTQQAGILGTNQYSATAQPFYQTAANMNQAASAPLTQSTIQNYMNPYESAVINPTVAQMENQFNQAQSSQLGNAIQNGAFGGDRAAVSAANLQNQQGLALGQTVGNLLNQNYGQAVSTASGQQQIGQAGANLEGQLGSGAQAAGLAGAQAQLTAGQAQQQTEQAGETALYNQFLQQESYPFQTTQFLANIAEGTGALSGSTTTSNQPAPFFSDERLKEDIEPIGKTFDGLNIIKFRYKGQKQPHIGLSAQDVEKKHPEAVGLAGGYKTVDYDAATREAVHHGKDRSSAGGLVLPSSTRRTFDIGGYAGLSPNSAWAAGFNLDPSYLQAQEAAYGNAPWGNAGPVSGATPYGGKSHVPPSTGSYHAALSVARTPSSQSSSGLQGLSQGIGQLEGLGKAGKSLFNDAKGYIPGLSPSASTGPQAASSAPPVQQTQMPPDKAAPTGGSSSPVAPTDTGSMQMGSLDVGTPDLNGLDDLGDVFARRGGLIRRADGGGLDEYEQWKKDYGVPDNGGSQGLSPSDENLTRPLLEQDSTYSMYSKRGGRIARADGGAIAFPTPFPAGGWYAHHPETGEIIRGAKWQPGDMPPRFKTQEQAEKFGNKELSRQAKRLPRDSGGSTPTFAQPTDDTSDDQSAGGDVPYDSGTGSGGLDIPDDKSNNHLAVAQPPSQSGGGGGGFNPLGLITGALGLFGLADGGRVGLAGGGNPDNVALPANDAIVADENGNPTSDLGSSYSSWLNTEMANEGLGGHKWGPAHAGGSPSGPIISDNAAPGRDITVHKAAPAPQSAPTTGLNPDVPAQNAQPVQMVQDMGSGQHLTQPGEVLTQDNPGGVGDFLNRNQGLIVPFLHGLGTMASSNSRYLGSAILQGLGGAADSYENVQNEMQGRLGNQPIIQQRQNEALQSDLNAWQSYTAQTGANLSFADFERMKAQGHVQSNVVPRTTSNGAQHPYNYTIQEKNSLILPNGVPANQDPAYLAQFAAHNAGIHSEMVAGQVHQSNEQANAINGQNFTYNNQGNQVVPNGYTGRVMAQNQPIQLSKEANDYHDNSLKFNENYQTSASLLNEMDHIYQGWQSGPTAEWRAEAEKFIQDVDPNGAILGHTTAGENNDKIMKDIGMLTARQLSTMSQGAPKDAHELVSSFSAEPTRSPGALRDLIIRSKSYLNQMNDYYNGYDPYNSNKSVFQYQKDFLKSHPFEGYRAQLEKSTPPYAGQNPQTAPPAQAGGPPVISNPADARKLPSGTVFMTPDGRRLVAP